MKVLKTKALMLMMGLALGLGGCTVYVVPADERDASADTMAEAEDQASEEPAEMEDADPPPERNVRRRDEAAARDSAAAEAEREARAREEAEREARAEAERQARAEAERRAREEAERLAREEAERQARLEAEAEARQAAERAAREREARLQEEREAVEREARLAAERGAAERNAGEREAGLREARAEARAGSRELHVPPGHHPPEGECRIWYEDRPPGRQPAAAPCEELLDGAIDPGVFILYGGESWDGSHDWEAAELAHPGAVPRPVLALSRIVGGDGTSGDESESIGSSGGIEDPRPTASSGPPEDRPGRGRSGSSPAPR